MTIKMENRNVSALCADNGNAYVAAVRHKRSCQQCSTGNHYCNVGRQLIDHLNKTRVALGYADAKRAPYDSMS